MRAACWACAGRRRVGMGGAGRAKRGRGAGGGRLTRGGSGRGVGWAAALARGRAWGVRAHLRTRLRPPCPVAQQENLRRKLTLEFGARATALTP